MTSKFKKNILRLIDKFIMKKKCRLNNINSESGLSFVVWRKSPNKKAIKDTKLC